MQVQINEHVAWKCVQSAAGQTQGDNSADQINTGTSVDLNSTCWLLTSSLYAATLDDIKMKMSCTGEFRMHCLKCFSMRHSFLCGAAGSVSHCEWQVMQTRPPLRGEEGSWLEGETGLASLAWISPSWSQTAEWRLVAALSLDRVTHSLISGEVNNSHTLEPQNWNHTALAA